MSSDSVSKVTRDFLVIALRSLRQELVAKGHGVAQQNISQRILKAHPIRLPSLDEQQRIVAKVDELLEMCDRLDVAIETAQADGARLLEAVLREALAEAP